MFTGLVVKRKSWSLLSLLLIAGGLLSYAQTMHGQSSPSSQAGDRGAAVRSGDAGKDLLRHLGTKISN